jgi:mono/diheme cytochrome c family protein
MAGRSEPVLDDEKRSYGAVWLVCSLLLFVGALWAVVDDNVFRRPWKKYQVEFNGLEIQRLEQAIADEQRRLDADPAYQEAATALEEARRSLASGEQARTLARLEAELHRARLADQSKDLDLRFVKSELEEWRFFYDDALHHGRPTDEIQRGIDEREAVRAEREKIYRESQQHIEELENEIKAVHASVRTAEDALAKLTTARDGLRERLEAVSIGYYPGTKASPPFFGFDWQPKIPKIQQIVLPEFDRNNFDQPIDRVDRCPSCHAGIDKAGFEDQPNPWKTHPRRDLLLAKHPPEKFGCTPCHQGEGPDVNSPDRAHGNRKDEHGHVEALEFQEHPLNRGEKVQTLCIKCHAGVQGLEGAEVIGRGEKLFVELGCHGCHLAEGYEELARRDGVTAIGPSLRRVGAKLDHAWLVRWVKNPHEVRPRTRMPNFMLDEGQAVQIAAFVLSAAREPSGQWLEGRPAPTVADGAALVERGKGLVDSLGCRACHGVGAGEVAGQVGADKDIAPNLAAIG